MRKYVLSELDLEHTDSAEPDRIIKVFKKIPKGHLGKLNRRGLEQIQRSGKEIEILHFNTQRVGAREVNPLRRLSESGKITHQEYAAAKKYQSDYAHANIDHYARPTLIYEGLPGSAASTKSQEGGSTQFQIGCSRRVEFARKQIAAASRPRQYSGFKDFKTPGARRFSEDLKLSEILEKLFEKEWAKQRVADFLNIDYSTVEVRAKKICEVLIAI